MWVVLYGWTPEIFARRSACRTASALSQLGGMPAPFPGRITGRSLPVYTRIVLLFAAVYVVMLKDEPRGMSEPGSVEEEGSRLCSDFRRS
ncbi:hypothetical protein BKA70DRAFT_129742 [Coprinopsis sp. MPI-PUGE-AT-0042]|nr:hypothetical protein BKA70DRAFT_129742 [Coprinopsis sp. MPI-PUGE-AT-0042]